MLITENERIKVCDLGFARTAKKTKRMSIAGTGLYMAPEVMTGDQYDGKCDIFRYLPPSFVPYYDIVSNLLFFLLVVFGSFGAVLFGTHSTPFSLPPSPSCRKNT